MLQDEQRVNITSFWYVTLGSVKKHKGFRGVCSLWLQGVTLLHLFSSLKIEAAGSSETLVFVYQTTQLHIPEGCSVDATLKPQIL
jgi:hypothetical protein